MVVAANRPHLLNDIAPKASHVKILEITPDSDKVPFTIEMMINLCSKQNIYC